MIPFKAEVSGLAKTDYGIMFTGRGIGYMIGCHMTERILVWLKNAHLALALGLAL
jgi:hypothetical protein